MFSSSFKALATEAHFTNDMLAAGATQIYNANYANKGAYFQAFTSLSTGLERIGKLCLMLDHYIDSEGKFPDFVYMKNEIGHKIVFLYKKSVEIRRKRSIKFEFLQNLDSQIYQAILKVLSDFAEGDRYSNINLLVGGKQTRDPIYSWLQEIDVWFYKNCVTERKKQKVMTNAAIAAHALGNYTCVRHFSEMGTEITDVEEASIRTGIYEAVAPYRQLYVMHIIRYWVELLISLQYQAMRIGHDIPFFSEVFGRFYNEDSYIKTRKTWDSF